MVVTYQKSWDWALMHDCGFNLDFCFFMANHIHRHSLPVCIFKCNVALMPTDHKHPMLIFSCIPCAEIFPNSLNLLMKCTVYDGLFKTFRHLHWKTLFWTCFKYCRSSSFTIFTSEGLYLSFVLFLCLVMLLACCLFDLISWNMFFQVLFQPFVALIPTLLRHIAAIKVKMS